MNTTILDLELFPLRRDVISDEHFVISNYALGYVMLMVSLVGVVTNFVNIRTFLSMGLDEGITVTLMGLAVSDLGFTVFGCVLSFSNILGSEEVWQNLKTLPVQPIYVFGMFSSNLGYMFYQVTCMTTTFMAIARCMCVAMPFRFKDFFTKSRSVIALVIFNLIASASYVPVLSQMGVRRKFDPIVNKTRFVLWMSDIRSDIKDVVSFIHFVVFVLVSSLVVGICIVVMAKHLRASVKFRHLAAKGTEVAEGDGKSNYKFSGKELQVVQQVIVICIIYTLCMVPTIFYAVYRLVDDEFDVGKRLNNLHFTIAAISTILQLVNSATTLPVYYTYNSKFRSQFVSCSKTKL